MIIGSMLLKLIINNSNSLKEKRMIIKSITSKSSSKYNFSVAEVDDQDIWNLSTIGFAMVSNEKTIIERSFQKLINDIDNLCEVEIIQRDINYEYYWLLTTFTESPSDI